MASITQVGKKYRAQVCVVIARGEKPVRKTKLFESKRDARKWAAAVEADLLAMKHGKADERFTLGQAIERYIVECVPKLKTAGKTTTRIRFLSDFLPTAKRLSDVTDADIKRFRDARLETTSAGTVLRDLAMVSGVFEAARKDWRWIDANPVRMIEKPKSPKHRERVIGWREVRALLRILGYRTDIAPHSSREQVAVIFLLALRTGMRSKEVTQLEWRRVHERYVHLADTKTNNPRNVDLGYSARRLIARMHGLNERRVFTVSDAVRDAVFRHGRTLAGLEGFTFHDARHTAATLIAKSGKVSVLELCKMFGWRDPRYAMVYFNPEPGHLSERL